MYDIVDGSAEIIRFYDDLKRLVQDCRFSDDRILRLTYDKRIMIEYIGYNDMLARYLTLKQLRLKTSGWLISNVQRINRIILE